MWFFILLTTLVIFKLISRELGKRQVIEREVNTGEQRFQAVFDNAGLGIAIFDLAGRIKEANPALAAMVGYQPGELRGTSLYSLTYVEDVAGEEIKFKQALRSGATQPYRLEKRLVRRDGSSFFGSQTVSLARGADGRITYGVAVIEDITRAKEIDRAKSEFVTLASHQLRTPLTIVGWYTEAILSGVTGELNQKQRHYFNNIIDANKRMIQLVSDLLNTSRVDTGRFIIHSETTDVAAEAEVVLETLRSRIENRLIHIEKNYAGSLRLVRVDRNLFGVVLQNLLSNAVKYSQPNGRVRLLLVADDKQLTIEVADNGLGIPEAYRGQMFKKFSRADNIQELEPDGTGLGLYLVKSLVDQAGGEVWYESVEGQGTTFHVVLPFRSKTRK